MRKIFFRSPYNYDADEVSRETGVDSNEKEFPSLAIQSAKEECDINNIMKNFRVTGQLPTNLRTPSYGDYDTIGDFQTAMNVIREAEETFMQLDAQVRAKFGNSPQAFLEFCSDPENLPAMRKMGLAIPEKVADNAATPESPGKEKGNDSGSSKVGIDQGDKAAGGSAKAADG